MLFAMLGARIPSAETAPAPTPSVSGSSGSPRAAVQQYLDLCREARYVEAATFVPVPQGREADGPRLARRLKSVLDRHLWLDPARISGAEGGDDTDGLPTAVDEIGQVPGPSGPPEGVRVERIQGPDGLRWVFARSTVARIDAWFLSLPDAWLLERMPAPLLRPGPLHLLWWQWMALPALALTAWAAGRILGWGTRRALSRIAARTDREWDEILVQRVSRPLTVGWAVGAAYLLVGLLGLGRPAYEQVARLLDAGLLVAFFWALWRSADVASDLMMRSRWAVARTSSRALVPLVARGAKAVVAGMGTVTVISQLGYPVASLVAGLGIGGVAVALAAQKTVENLFGAFSLGVDQPFREGDYVRIGELTGTVEIIGLRSTRIRTLDRTLVTIPNGRLAEMNIETYAARDRIRLSLSPALAYGTTAAQMREALTGIERVLRSHPLTWPDEVVVRLAGFGESALTLEVMAWCATTDPEAFRTFRQEVLLGFLEAVEASGTSFAVTTRVVQVG